MDQMTATKTSRSHPDPLAALEVIKLYISRVQIKVKVKYIFHKDGLYDLR